VARYPVLYAGQRFTAELATAMEPDVYNKDNSEVRASTTTLNNDAELQAIPLAVGEYKVRMGLNLTGGSGGIAIKTQWAFTGTWNNPIRRCDGPTSANTVAPSGTMLLQHATYTANSNCIYGLYTGNAYTIVKEECFQVIVTVAGSLSLAWGPNTSSATSGGVMQGSWVEVKQIG
jgi:hypothetical protein